MSIVKELFGLALLFVWWEGTVCIWYSMGRSFLFSLGLMLLLLNFHIMVVFGVLDGVIKCIRSIKKIVNLIKKYVIKKIKRVIRFHDSISQTNNRRRDRVINFGHKLIIRSGRWKYLMIFVIAILSPVPLTCSVLIVIVKTSKHLDSNKGFWVLITAYSVKALLVIGGVYLIGQPIIDPIYAIHIHSIRIYCKIIGVLFP